MSAAVIQFLSKTMSSQTFNSDGTFTVPAGVSVLYILGAGGGGGGAGGNSGGTLAGGGGAGAVPQLHVMQVSPGQNWTVTIGDGGDNGSVDQSGDPGGNSSFIRSGIGPIFYGAEGGFFGGGTLPSTSNGGRRLSSEQTNSDALDVDYTAFATWNNEDHVTYGGRGDAVNGGSGQAGQDSPYASGGAGGSGSDRGGGGGAGFGTGGNGSSTTSGTASTGGRSAGGGGGGGAKAGGNGGPGRIIVFW
jgi:hypothetical protein